MQFCLRRREDRQCRPRNVHGRTVHVGPGRKINTTGRKDGRVPNLVLPEFGRVDTSWFADAAFLGDSLTAGFCENEYNIDVGGALICGYEGVSPNTIVNRTTAKKAANGTQNKAANTTQNKTAGSQNKQ